jgi:hypothetical protein
LFLQIFALLSLGPIIAIHNCYDFIAIEYHTRFSESSFPLHKYQALL